MVKKFVFTSPVCVPGITTEHIGGGFEAGDEWVGDGDPEAHSSHSNLLVRGFIEEVVDAPVASEPVVESVESAPEEEAPVEPDPPEEVQESVEPEEAPVEVEPKQRSRKTKSQ